MMLHSPAAEITKHQAHLQQTSSFATEFIYIDRRDHANIPVIHSVNA